VEAEMPDSRPNIQLTANTQTDIYAALNAQAGFPAVAVGTKLLLQNLGTASVRLTSKATAPVDGDGFKRVASGQQAFNEDGDLGGWAYSPVIDGEINVGVSS